MGLFKDNSKNAQKKQEEALAAAAELQTMRLKNALEEEKVRNARIKRQADRDIQRLTA